MRKQGRPGAGGALMSGFTFALFSCYAVMALLIVLMGANVYRSVDAASTANNASRTALSYIAGKVRAADAAGMVSTERQDDMDLLVLGGVYGGERYNTYIYCDGGALSECFQKAEYGFDASLGDSLVDASNLALGLAGNCLTVTVTGTAGETHGMTLYLQCGGGGNGP